MHSNAATIRFALIVTLTCSFLLAAAATLLKPRQIENVELDIKKNILKSVGLKPEDGGSFSREQIQKLYSTYIKEYVIDGEGKIIEGKTPDQIDPKKDSGLYPLYEYEKDGSIQAYVIPISGKGLWSTIKGYFALDPDGSTVRGITFYSHGETPGLGGEIEKEWFTNNFIGKKITDPDGQLVSIGIVRGKVKDKIPEGERYHYVDGISGATLTGRGVTKFLKTDLQEYNPFFEKIRNSQKGVIHG